MRRGILGQRLEVAVRLLVPCTLQSLEASVSCIDGGGGTMMDDERREVDD